MVYSGIHEAEDRFFCNKTYKPPTITMLLFKIEDIIVSRQGVARILEIYKETGTIDRRRGVLDTVYSTVRNATDSLASAN